MVINLGEKILTVFGGDDFDDTLVDFTGAAFDDTHSVFDDF